MDSILVKKGLKELLKYLPVEIPSMGWYFSEVQPEDAFTFEINKRNCMFNHLKSISILIGLHNSDAVFWRIFSETIRLQFRIW